MVWPLEKKILNISLFSSPTSPSANNNTTSSFITLITISATCITSTVPSYATVSISALHLSNTWSPLKLLSYNSSYCGLLYCLQTEDEWELEWSELDGGDEEGYGPVGEEVRPTDAEPFEETEEETEGKLETFHSQLQEEVTEPTPEAINEDEDEVELFSSEADHTPNEEFMHPEVEEGTQHHQVHDIVEEEPQRTRVEEPQEEPVEPQYETEISQMRAQMVELHHEHETLRREHDLLQREMERLREQEHSEDT